VALALDKFLHLSREGTSLFVGRSLGLVSLLVHHTEKAEGFPSTGLKLVPRHGRDRDDVVEVDVSDLVSDEHLPLAPDHNHHVFVVMTFQSGVSPRLNLEIAELGRHSWSAGKEGLARDGSEVVPFLFVGVDAHFLPGEGWGEFLDHGFWFLYALSFLSTISDVQKHTTTFAKQAYVVLALRVVPYFPDEDRLEDRQQQKDDDNNPRDKKPSRRSGDDIR
jgi:hypothetical protein